ncbi:MAG TPA: serine/threonine-protein kinase [Tepidisphaeraceae bacterium]|nr:serine/threonine-protein kinase [Tepidisphaeraceae bacterium]
MYGPVADSPSVETDRLPKSLFGYEVLDFIGEGAGSRIFAVSHPATKQVYALKYVTPKAEKDVRFVEQLEAEYEVGRQVGHAGLRRSLDLKVNRTLFRKITEAGLVLELFDGLSLERRPPHSMTHLVEVFVQTAEALGALHAMGYVHCDLKPNNILIDASRRVKVIDLGQAAKAGMAKNRIQGTPDYIAPEQVKCLPVTPQTDVFNLGATMYWALCGKKMPTLFNIGKGQNSFLLDVAIPKPHECNRLVPEQLSNLVMECVRTSPAKRPADMTELSRRLEIILHVMRKQQAQAAGGKRTSFQVA